jgi:rare lipoprotein A
MYKPNFSDTSQDIIDSPAMHKATMRKYKVNGKLYYPKTQEIGEKIIGTASWYGPNFNGKKTSNGETYDMHKFTGAHKTLPMNTIIKVLNLENDKQVNLRINDRGPFVDDRILDLSFAASKALGIYTNGTAKVEIEILGFNAKIGVQSRSSQQFKKDFLENVLLQIGVFSTRKKAKSIADMYSDEEHIAKINSYNKNGKILFRVVIHNFKNEDEAKEFKENHHLETSFITGE